MSPASTDVRGSSSRPPLAFQATRPRGTVGGVCEGDGESYCSHRLACEEAQRLSALKPQPLKNLIV